MLQWGRWGYQVMESRNGASWKEIELLTDWARVRSQGMLGSCPL